MTRNLICFFLFFFIHSAFSAQLQAQSVQKLLGNNEVRHNPWELIIYRPENSAGMNEERCYLSLEDTEGNAIPVDVKNYPKGVSATYAWSASPNKINRYEHTAYLSGGMAMHLHLLPGIYRISFYTPPEKQFFVKTENKGTWVSQQFIYDTENPVKVIFVSPTADDNGFYSGGWYIDYKAPKFYKFTKPKNQ